MSPSDPSDANARALRLATAGAVGASVVHELRNTLSVVASSIYLARRDRGNEARLLAHLDKASGEINRAQAVVGAVLGLARGEVAAEEVPLSPLVTAARTTVSLPAHISFSATIVPEDLAVRGDPVLLERLLSNLYQNALDALAGRPTGHLETHASLVDDAIEVTVTDDGPGFSEEVLPRLFDPLVTTRAEGTGLGLALVKVVAEVHGGSAEAFVASGGGAGVRVRLPRP